MRRRRLDSLAPSHSLFVTPSTPARRKKSSPDSHHARLGAHVAKISAVEALAELDDGLVVWFVSLRRCQSKSRKLQGKEND
jgi:hypothetical protein